MGSGILFGIVAMLSLGVSTGITKEPSKQLSSTKVVFYRNVLICIMMVAILFAAPPHPISVKALCMTVLIAVLAYVPLYTFFRALSVGKVGVVAPVANSSGAVTIMLAIIFFGERLSMEQGLAAMLIVAGIVLISVDVRNWKKSTLFKRSSGMPMALATCLLWGIVFFLYKFCVDAVGPWVANFIIELGILIVSAAAMSISKQRFDLPRKYWLTFVWLAVAGTIGGLAYNIGISTSHVSVVAALYMANPLIAALYARFFYKERLSRMQYVSAVIIIVGVIGMSLW